MPFPLLVICLISATLLAYAVGLRRSLALASAKGAPKLHSLPEHHGLLVALWCGIPAALVLGLWVALEGPVIYALVLSTLPEALSSLPADRLGLAMNEVGNAARNPAATSSPEILAAASYMNQLHDTSSYALAGATLSLGGAGALLASRRMRADLRARSHVEGVFKAVIALSSSIAVLTTIGIVVSVLFEAIRFFNAVPIFDFLFGLTWSPQTAIRSDQVGASGSFGAVPLFTGTFLISGIALSVGAPLGLMCAIYLAEYAEARTRAVAKPMLEILAGIPTVVFGFFAALTVAPLIRDIGAKVGLSVASESALAAGTVMGIMLIPFVSSLSDDVIVAVPQALRDGSYAVGATRSETIRKVVIPAALPGIVGALLLAVSRAIGETMIVVMAAGLSANLTANPFEAVTTVTVQIVTLLVGDQEFDSPKTLAAFALGLVLFVMTLSLNVLAIRIVRKYREQYD
jgi:phosphate transport system permease protein